MSRSEPSLLSARHSDDKARLRMDAIEPLLEILEISAAQQFPHLFGDGQCAACRREAIAWCATRSGRSTRTIERLLARFKSGGKDALSQRVRNDKGKSRFFARHPRAAEFVAYLSLTRKLRSGSICRALCRNLAAFEIAADGAPSNMTVAAFLKSTPMPDLIALALRGQKRYRALVTEYAKRRFFEKEKRTPLRVP